MPTARKLGQFDICADPAHDCGCHECDIATDDFNRADAATLGANWTLLSGTQPTIVSNEADFSAAGFVRHVTTYPGGIGESRHATIRVKFSTAGSVQICVGLTTTTYFAAELRYEASGCSVLHATYNGFSGCVAGPSIYNCVQVPGLTTGELALLEVCLEPNVGAYPNETFDRVIAKVTLANGKIYSCQLEIDGPAVGLYAGVRTSMAAKVDDFTYTYFRNSPTGQNRTCPNCSTPCFISSDDFTTNEPCLWDVRAGSYSVASGVMTITTSPSTIQHHIFHPGLKTAQIVTVKVNDIASVARIYIGNGYAVLTITATTRTLQLYSNAAVLLDDDTVSIVPGGGFLDVTVCYSRGLLSATVGSLCADAAIAETASAYWVSLGGDNGTVFDDFVFKKSYDTSEPSDAGCDDCTNCPNECNNCCDSPQPAGAYVVDFVAGGWTAGSWYAYCTSCAACAETAGEFLLIADSSCGWAYGEDNCTGFDSCVSGAQVRFGIDLELWNDGTGNGCRWKLSVSIGAQITGPTDDGTFCCTDTPCDAGGDGGGRTTTLYYSAYITDTECNTMPVTLTKISETVTCPCNGSLPTTITLSAA